MELNIYGDVSGGAIFDKMDRAAHEKAIKVLGDCVTISASINFIGKTISTNFVLKEELFWSHGNKACVNVCAYGFETMIATASFLFIKRK